MKTTLYLTAEVLPGNRIEIKAPNLSVGQTVEVVILVPETTPNDSNEKPTPFLEQRLAFLKLPMDERRRILESQAETAATYYQQDFEWQELMSGDIINY